MKALTLKDRFGLDRFFLGERRVDDKPLILNQRRIFILPTQRGFGFALLIVLLVLIAFVYNNNLAYMLAFLLASIFFITILHTYKSLAGLTIQEGQTIAVFTGESAGFGVHVDNPTSVVRQHIQLKMQSVENFNLQAHSKAHLTLYDPTQKRGWHPAGTMTVSSTYPLGLFRAWSPIRFNAKALVYPKPADQKMPFPETGATQNPHGQFKKGGDEFYDLQSYQAGDPIKHLHWKAYARGLGLFSKQYGGENSAEIWLDFGHAPGQSIEERLSYLCRWVVDAEQAGLNYGFVIPGLRLEPGNGKAHYQRCLEALALF
ncbi:conserved hypothetical protein [Crenothrix polyspora]|uniref:Uncharacterized protein n=1 Tax=Crenothrix polyspora TaxID=360316 RepID=A0A1R4H6W4_9GAMM|nr:DUF58 domain-containing protein [Crenothrix polyspora]SJM91761.1 conserved hypothetical protein [Crenothrix polyspora]